MKKIDRFWVMGFMVLGMAFSTVVWAEDQGAQGPDDHPGMGGDMEQGMMGQGRLEMLKKKLGLTDSQASQMKDVFKKQQTDNKTTMDQMKVDMDTLQLKVDSKASDDEIHKLLDKLDSEQKSLQASREKMKEKLRAILTPTQQAKFLLGMKKMAVMGKKGQWGKRKGHGPGPQGSPRGGSDQGGNALPAGKDGSSQ